jgi:PleD family two-component response regulator
MTATWGFVFASTGMDESPLEPASVFQTKPGRNAAGTGRARNDAMQPRDENRPPGRIRSAGEEDEPTKVLLVDADPALAELLEKWLADHGCRVVDERPDLVLVDLPVPRERGLARLRQLGDAHPNTPVVAMPKPLIRDAFAAALRRALDEIQ